jgi:hypothetical protein
LPLALQTPLFQTEDIHKEFTFMLKVYIGYVFFILFSSLAYFKTQPPPIPSSSLPYIQTPYADCLTVVYLDSAGTSFKTHSIYTLLGFHPTVTDQESKFQTQSKPLSKFAYNSFFLPSYSLSPPPSIHDKGPERLNTG